MYQADALNAARSQAQAMPSVSPAVHRSVTRQRLQTSEVVQLKTKKAQLNPTVVALVLANPIVLLGIGIFIMLLLILGYFALGKMVAALFLVFGAISLFTGKLHWSMGLLLIATGVLFWWNPGDFLNLSALQLG